MKEINLEKYGFVRCEALDFVDDENSFKMYRYGFFEISFLQNEIGGDDWLFIDTRSIGIDALFSINDLGDGKITSKDKKEELAHYEWLHKLNGINLTESKVDVDSLLKQYVKALCDLSIEFMCLIQKKHLLQIGALQDKLRKATEKNE